MEKISGYDVVLTFSPIEEITGHVFEVFDYYLFLRDYFKVGMLFLGSIPPDKLEIAFNSKYIERFENIKKDLIYYPVEDIKTGKNIFYFDKSTFVLLCDGNIQALESYKISLLSKLLYGFLCFSDEQITRGFGSSLTTKIIYLLDCRIYDKTNHGFKTIPYVKKLPFKHYKRVQGPQQNIGMIYMTFNCRKISPYTVLDYHWKSGCKKSLLVVPEKLDQYEGLEGIEQVVAPVQDFFQKFDTYIYTPVARHFDCSPRLVTECFMQGKKVLIDLDYVDPGLQTRVKDCQEDLESLNLKDGDKIVEIINQARRESKT